MPTFNSNILKTSDFDYYLPFDFIAQFPVTKRDESRLMVLSRRESSLEHRFFSDIVDCLSSGDLLVLNDTKVIPANLVGRKAEGIARIEVLLAKHVEKSEWLCLVKPGKRLKVGSKVIFSSYLTGEVLKKLESGEQIIRFNGELDRFMKEKGEIPLPPYITDLRQQPADHKLQEMTNRYQTVYAQKDGATAAPTAGLHFTPELLARIESKGVEIKKITLHTGLGTFKPVYTEYIKDHKMHEEDFEISVDVLRSIKKAKRVIAVGTTTVRTLETLAHSNRLNALNDIYGSTDIFIYPGFKFKVVDAMITNFHVPKSTLLMLVSAFAGREFILNAYKEAIDNYYRFFSFGDAMLIF
ncbi:tRNA preQ1(34) S-adenosylmethionine ribosyltransferase-isomerase QueA [candidate division WOR-1 bacterium RIFOXYD2_FULL_36_8]|uniref:S-adenosylmethionine:tRNA ribosyltransferase-isomerase n=1 Tax=candidate division WOR-1 bacterium RIFOXYB2_FULL_36_35 TaxID=1802578 RepID=A0A1F4S8Q9_UNCSA|nr:MAG: tRNA preQ1(34) S-adenosylmethionine ribosyltransferase-isomerase QueA [candidate division WOR-1 bacterium RIFOXYA2_FULL_36_21]OGC16802.1 MAG: tRNA preQ1(34) S-adenosylmethionine ribosyltransferase-isomerase QueA [candidate division WOR-1 bacterium RIFOXYB2_FULL_36_35]OGC19817.1 MAG: tRNA preQ1(34) S-adenosylmethionine ribosyltransferase-isomerase QueA [candidate division WOR-1 bacterium RIFOXYA12_FULL_36_13]OGC37308.1 MAG: tRNA preQ1(34) S-adenosylmethionine ribosyltransferase-isomerase 